MGIEYEEDWRARRLVRTIDDKGVQQWTADRAWDVTGTKNETTALNSVAEAQLLAPHDQAAIMRVKTHDATRKGFGVVRVTANYTIQTLNNSNGDPLKALPEYTFGESEEMYPADRDINGEAIVNSAGEAFEGGASFPLKTFLYGVTINQPFYDANIVARFVNALNDASFKTPFGTYQKGESLFYSCLPASPFHLNDLYVPVAYLFKIRLRANFPNMPKGASPFDVRFLDQGLNARCVVKATGKPSLAPIVDAGGHTASQAVRLNSRGVPVESQIGGGDDSYNIKTGMSKEKPPTQTMKNGQVPKACKIEKTKGTDVKAYFLWYQMFKYESFGQLRL